jgi:hypothetical protein
MTIHFFYADFKHYTSEILQNVPILVNDIPKNYINLHEDSSLLGYKVM